jgi:hypothetical protein
MLAARPLRPLALTLVVALVGRPAAAHAQRRVEPDTIGSAKRPGVIEGIVTDSSLIPIPGAEVAVVSSGIAVRTGLDGRFRLPCLPRPSCILIVRRIGFFPASMIVRLSEFDTLHVSFTLDPAAQELESVTVMGEPGDALRLLEFEYRRRFGKGRYLSKLAFDWYPGARTADLLRRLGMPLTSLRTVDGQVKQYVGDPRAQPARPAPGGDPASAAMLARCEGRVFLNGVALPAPVDIDDLPAPRELAGIEVYKGAPPPIPLHYGGMSACGDVSMLWTASRK